MSKYVGKFRKNQDYMDDYKSNQDFYGKKKPKGVKNESSKIRGVKLLHHYEDMVEDGDSSYEEPLVR